MVLTVVGVFLISIAFIALLISVFYFLGHRKMLFGFDKGYKETEATLKGFITRGLDTPDDPSGAIPIIEYYNEFLNKTVKKEIINSGIIAAKDAFTKNEKNQIASAGEKIKIQYTAKAERVIDSRFVLSNKYEVSRYILPIILSIIVGIIGVITLIISIIL